MNRNESIANLFQKVDEVEIADFIDPAMFIPIKGIACCVKPSGHIDVIPLFGLHRPDDHHPLKNAILDLLYDIRSANEPVIPSARYTEDGNIEWRDTTFKQGSEGAFVYRVVKYLVIKVQREIIKRLPGMNFWSSDQREVDLWMAQDFNVGRISITKCKYTLIHGIMDAFNSLFKGFTGRTYEYRLYKSDGSLVWSSGQAVFLSTPSALRVELLDSLSEHFKSKSQS